MIRSELFIQSCVNVKFDEQMSAHTYYRIGGPAAVYAAPDGSKELAAVVEVCKENNIPYYILGRGSNILVSDRGFDGCVIDMTESFRDIAAEGNLIAAGAGSLLSAVAKEAAENSLTGFEELAGIPGTVGGALVMNAGCYGKEISSLVLSADILSEGKIVKIEKNDIGFGYRHSGLKGRIVTGAVFALEKGDPEAIGSKMAEYSALRRSKQPLNYPSCGSVFKRPQEGFAGKFIEDAGLKGKTIGSAMVSDLHAGFIINTGTATAQDVLSLIKLIKVTVKEKFGVELNEEVIYLGFSDEELK
ncbi:MAG: UDP-N-acetylmuramate dehydrogenase [Candidatus Delongbacteria bacterium]|nr:UDP-N-acetylmuramate dehydrogenase [Candidatus Delongbacteria bacterium]MDD4205958.1 UDP-N-acetylmuramate dehydrogenase [Candidatus Delongbacteria bacterium]